MVTRRQRLLALNNLSTTSLVAEIAGDAFLSSGEPNVYPLGSDIEGTTDLTSAMGTVGGPLALSQALVRRLTTTTGDYQDYPGYGFDGRDLIGTAVTGAGLAQARQLIVQQCLAEEEVLVATCNITYIGSTLKIVVNYSTAEGPFEFTILVDDDLNVSAIIP